MSGFAVTAAFCLDLVLGDPRVVPHPVVLIGRFIRSLEEDLLDGISDRRFAGILLVVATLSTTAATTWGILFFAALLGEWVFWIVSVWVAYTCLALRSLHGEAFEVVRLVEVGRLDEARRALSLLVSRDTTSLDEEGILRACFETVAENTSDGVIAPLFYLLIGGPILAMTYKAASTLDSMVGYKTERYRLFGWASARLDDLLNWIPARLTGVAMTTGAFILGYKGGDAWRIMLRDAKKHDSPNAGWPEAAAAGAFGVRLGGSSVYFGEVKEKPTLGDPVNRVTAESCRGLFRLVYGASVLTLLGGLIVKGVLS